MIFVNKLNKKMTADSLAELHILAKKYGINQAWFHGSRTGMPCYDIPASKLEKIMATKGAQIVDSKVFLAKSKALGKAVQSLETKPNVTSKLKSAKKS